VARDIVRAHDGLLHLARVRAPRPF
jgi:hypothetical protein